jgi:hypothetical protein
MTGRPPFISAEEALRRAVGTARFRSALLPATPNNTPIQTQELIGRVAPIPRSRAAAGGDNAERTMTQQVEEVRRQYLPRYYDLIREYAVVIIRSWCIHVYEVLHACNNGPGHPAARPCPLSLLDSMAETIDSRNAENIAIAVEDLRYCILGDVLQLNSFQQTIYQQRPDQLAVIADFQQTIYQRPEELAIMAELAELLSQLGIEQERRVWEPLMRLHTGISLEIIIQENTRVALGLQVQEAEPEYGEAGSLMDQLDEVGM